MVCKTDEYYDSRLRDCRQCSLICDPPYASSEHQEECLSNCPDYRKTGAPVVVPAMGQWAYLLIALAVFIIVTISVIIVFVLCCRKRLRCKRVPVEPPVSLTEVERFVSPIQESKPPDPSSSPGIPLHVINNRAMSTSTTVR